MGIALGISVGVGTLLLAIIIGIVFAMLHKRVDKDEDECEQMAGIFQERLHYPEMGAVFRKLGRLNVIGAIRAVKQAWAAYGGEKIWILITKITVKNIPAVLHSTDHTDGLSQRLAVAQAIANELPGLMAADDTSTLIDDAIFSEATGLKLTQADKANLVLLATRLGAWGLVETQAILMDFASDTPQASKALIQSVANQLSTEDGTASLAKTVLQKLVPHLMSGKDNAAWLRALVAAQPVVA